MNRLAVFLLTVALAGGATAQGAHPTEIAKIASQRLKEAATHLQSAESGRDRVAALTNAIRAYEDGLSALRDGIRRAAIRQSTLETDLAAREADVTRLLGVLQTLSRTPPPALLLHPDGPAGTARSGLLLAEVTPALQQEARELAALLDELEILQSLQENAETTLNEGLTGAQQARAELSDALGDRRELPKRFIDDPIGTALLIASTETLDAFASGLGGTIAETLDTDAPDATQLKGTLPLPVNGTILRRAGDMDAGGNVRPGIVIATRPEALVTAPATATVRFHGPLLDYGNVVILEPAPDVLLVLAGLDALYAEVGTILPAGAPIGLMGDDRATSDGKLSENPNIAPVPATQTLYLEVREGQGPVDPALWFAFE